MLIFVNENESGSVTFTISKEISMKGQNSVKSVSVSQKAATKVTTRQQRERKREEINRRRRKYYAENKKKESDRKKQHYRENREKILQRQAIYRRARKSAIRRIRAEFIKRNADLFPSFKKIPMTELIQD
jgi:hypothetical protein